jgi:hypothetical protein
MYTPTAEELQVYLKESQGKKYALVLCPHCGKGSKVALERITQSLRFSPPTSAPTPASAPSTGGEAPTTGLTGEDSEDKTQ